MISRRQFILISRGTVASVTDMWKVLPQTLLRQVQP